MSSKGKHSSHSAVPSSNGMLNSVAASSSQSRDKKGAVGRKRIKTSSKSSKAGLHFPVGRIGRYLKDGRYAPRIGVKSSVFLAAVLEYLCTEVLDLAANEAKDAGKARISPRHIQLAVRNDEELNTLLGAVTIASGGVIPSVNPVLFHKKGKGVASKTSKSADLSGAKLTADGGSREVMGSNAEACRGEYDDARD